MKYILCILGLMLLAGCAENGYKKFYKPFVDVKTLQNMEYLTPAQQPELLESNNFERDIPILRSKSYVAIGASSFNGGYEETKNAMEQAKFIGATVVLVGSRYTNTQTTTSMLLLPNNQITYQTGTTNSNTTYNNSLGGSLGTAQTTTTYNGTSTTYGTQAIPFTVNQRRYDQEAIFFVKIAQKFKFGVHLIDLTPEQRSKYERNTGALIDVVFEGSPAFNSNVLTGDLLISVDGILVNNSQNAQEIMAGVDAAKGSSELKVIRNGSEKIVSVKF